MKAFIITLLFLNSVNIYSQTERFEYGENGLNDYVVTKVDSISKENIYIKTVNWIKETYSNPDEVMTMKIENEKVRINGFGSNLLNSKGVKYGLSYIIEIAFKDGRYKFDIISLLYNNRTDYKAIPNFKTDEKLIKNFGDTPTIIENYFNDLNQSLKGYILGKSKKDDW